MRLSGEGAASFTMTRKRRRSLSESPEPEGSDHKKRHKCSGSTPKRVANANCVTHPVLCLYYPQVLTLRQFLLSKLPKRSRIRRRMLTQPSEIQDHESIVANPQLQLTLDRTLVGISEDPSASTEADRQRHFKSFTQSQQRSGLAPHGSPQDYMQAELVDYAIWAHFNRTGSSFSRPPHILCHGYIRSGAHGSNGGTRTGPPMIPGIAVQFPNAHVKRFKSAPWPQIRQLLGSSGDAVMRTLLFDCGIFIEEDGHDGEVLQVCGIPLCDMRPLPKKSSKSMGNNGLIDPSPRHKLRTANEIVLVRNRILYARPTMNSRGGVRFGLKHIHVFNRFSKAGDDSHTVHILKYVFPRQFGLHNVFTSSTDPKETVQPFKDYTAREQEIGCHQDAAAFRSRSVPKRLRGHPFELVRQMHWRHLRCSYTALLRYYCPIEQSGPSSNDAEVWTVSPRNTSLVTQVQALSSVGSLPKSTQEVRGGQTSSAASTDFATPIRQVSAFCGAVLQQILPAKALGVGPQGDENRRHLFRNVDRFVKMRRFETLTMHNIIQNIKVRSIPWLRPPTVPKDEKIASSDMNKRLELLSEFLYYVFDSILIPLIRSHFHVTESNMHRNQLFFFRHDIWQKLAEPSLRSLRTKNFEELPHGTAKAMFSSRAFGFTPLRLMPKRNGMRPITNLRRRPLVKQNGKLLLGSSINATLTPVFSMLNYEKRVRKQTVGSGLFSVGEMHGRLKDFKSTVASQGSNKLYFVKADVQTCFDSIPQHELIQVVRRIIKNHQYLVRKHAEVRAPDVRWAGHSAVPYRKFIATAAPVNNYSIGPGEQFRMPSGRRGTVIVDTGYQKLHDARRLLKLLEEHVNGNVVKIGKQYYRQKRGIPQGSILSSLLCNLFYGCYESASLGFLQEDSMLLRLIDDFLLITPNPSHARRFLQIMADGSERFGITTNPAKSLVNFEVTINGAKVPRLPDGDAFPYCGMLIDTSSLEVTKDHRREGEWVQNGLSIEINRTPGKTFGRRVLNSFKVQMHAMVVDSRLNSLGRVLVTFYQIHVETAMKMHAYVKGLSSTRLPSEKLIIQTCSELLQLVVNLTRGQRKTKLIDSYECAVTRRQHAWLMSRAFLDVLLRKQTRYSSLLRWLETLEEQSRSSMTAHLASIERSRVVGRSWLQGYRY